MAGLALLPAPLPAPVTGGFSTRLGGRSAPPYDELNLGSGVGDDPVAVTANRAALAAELGVPRIRFGRQVHGAEVHRVTGEEHLAVAGGEPVSGCDGLVTALPGVALGVLVADCVPVLLADVRAGVVAVAHAGRRGLVAGILQRTVAAIGELGGDPAETVAVVGPAIGGCCYEVPQDLAAAVAASIPEVRARTRWGTPALDLPRGAAAVLRVAGVGRVHRVPACTAEDDRFYSYRRSAVTGRFAGVLVRR